MMSQKEAYSSPKIDQKQLWGKITPPQLEKSPQQGKIIALRIVNDQFPQLII